MPEQKKSNGLVILLVVFNLIFLCATCGLVSVGGVYIYQQQRTNTSTTKNDANNVLDENVLDIQSDVINLVKKTQPSVVTVLVKGNPSNGIVGSSEEVTLGSGTGFFVSEDGLLITNEHVVCATDTSKLVIVTSDQKSFKVTNVAVDSAQDVAVLKVDTEGTKVAALKFANPNTKIDVGQTVIAIGNPLGTNPGSVTKGIVSGVNRNITAQGTCNNKTSFKDYEGVIQTDAAINSGNSGGPLIDAAGEVIGVNSATTVDANNISYAVPYNRVLKVLERYNKNGGKIASPFLGVEYNMIDSDTSKTENLPVGALVRNVVFNSPAAKGGIQKGDVITKLDDKIVDFSLSTTLSLYFEPNQTVKVEVYRPSVNSSNGQTLVLDVVIGTK